LLAQNNLKSIVYFINGNRIILYFVLHVFSFPIE